MLRPIGVEGFALRLVDGDGGALGETESEPLPLAVGAALRVVEALSIKLNEALAALLPEKNQLLDIRALEGYALPNAVALADRELLVVSDRAGDADALGDGEALSELDGDAGAEGGPPPPEEAETLGEGEGEREGEREGDGEAVVEEVRVADATRRAGAGIM